MILIDALYINNGGGKILLDYLIQQLSIHQIDAFYLLDNRVIGNHPVIPENKKMYMPGSIFKRHFFYKKNKNTFSKIFCFATIPPSIKMNVPVYTYFQQLIFVDIPNELPVIDRLKFRMKAFFIKCVSSNTDWWLVQSSEIKQKLGQRFYNKQKGIEVVPFYPEFEKKLMNIVREPKTYLYVSNAAPHKNHKALIDSFCQFFDKHNCGKLILTVSNDYPDVQEVITQKVNKYYPIENIGFVDRKTLQQIYYSSEFLIFPSLSESFGLGIVEAIECGCKVIGANLAYTFAVCEPSLVFEPTKKNSIFEAFEASLDSTALPQTVPKTTNNINQIISYLK